MKKLLVLFALTTIFSCNSSAIKLVDELPKWYAQPTQNDAHNLYGVGEGYTIDEATKSALNNLAGKLLSTINSESSSLMESASAGINEESRQKISQLIKNIDFASYEVTHSVQKDVKIYTEVAIDRDKFILNESEKLLDLNQRMEASYKSLAGKTILEKRNDLSKIVALSDEAKTISQILSGLGAGRLKENLKQYAIYQSAYDAILNKLEFYIDFKPETSKAVISTIRNALNKEKIKISKDNNSTNDNLVAIEITSEIITKNIYGSNITKLKVDFALTSNKRKTLASNNIETTGNSVIGGQESLNAAANALKEKINAEGILKIIGISN